MKLSRTVKALRAALHVEVEDDAMAARVAALLACYARADEPTYPIRIVGAGPYTLEVFDTEPYTASFDDVVYAFELALYRLARESCASSLLLHAAALGRGGGALVLCGASGAGKTTMTRELLEQGARYVTDEFCCIDVDAQVTGLPRVLRSEDATGPWSLTPAATQLEHASTPLRMLVLLRHDPNGRPEKRRLEAGEAMVQVWEHAWSTHERALEILRTIVTRTPMYAITTRTLVEARSQLSII